MPDTVTETTWGTSWTPPGEGAYSLHATLTDGLGAAITNTAAITVYVDLNPPAVSLSTAQITGQNLDEYGFINLSGLVTEAIGLQRLQVQVETAYTDSLASGLWQDVALPGGTTWQGAVYGGSPILPDGDPITLSVRAIDLAGQAAIVSRAFLADAAPPAPVTVTLAYISQLGTVIAITPGMTIHDADALSPTLYITWTAAADGSGIARYTVGWAVTRALSAAQVDALTTFKGWRKRKNCTRTFCRRTCMATKRSRRWGRCTWMASRRLTTSCLVTH